MSKKGILADLLAGPGNLYWDLARGIVTFFSTLIASGIMWNLYIAIRQGQQIDLGPTGLSGGLALYLPAAAALILAKDRSSRTAE